MKAKKLLALLLSGAMALTIGVMAACDNGGKTPSGNNPGGENPGGENPGGETPGGENPGGNYDYTLDNTEYYLVGTGVGDLKQNNWSNSNHVLAMERDEEADHNVFKKTIEMYAGDAFQICHDDSWAGQMGITFMYGVEEGEVKDEDGNVIFVGGGDYGNDIILQMGYDGVYTFSLHTFPDGEKQAYITYTKDADVAAFLDMYVVSDMNDFGSKQQKYKASHMEKNGSIWKYILTITEQDVCRNKKGEKVADGEYAAVAVWNDVENADGEHDITFDDTRDFFFMYGDAYNLLKAGVYTLKYNADEDILTIKDSALELYFVGSFNDGTASAEYKLTEDAEGNWSGYLKLEEAAQVSLYNKYSDSSYQVNGGEPLAAGEYVIKFITEEEQAVYEEFAYFLAGGFDDVFWGIGETSPKLTWDEAKKVYTVNLYDITALEFKVVYGTVLGGVKDWHGVGADGNDNVVISVEGDYTITYNPTTKAVTVTEIPTPVTVTFDLNYPADAEGPEGQVAPAAQTINKRQKATQPTEVLTLEGYTFLGWYRDREHNEIFDFSTPVTGNITLYAGWILTSEMPANPSITFNWNDGTGKTEVIETVGGLIGDNMPATPVREGYYFAGWFTAANGTEEFDFDTPVKINTTVYAHWIEADTRPWHIVGLLNWNTGDTTYMLEHDSDYPTSNVFSITITLYSGNAFKIIGSTSGWDPQINGSSVTVVNGEFGSDKDNNITVLKSGIYKLILSTDSGLKFTYTYTPVEAKNDIYFQVNGTEKGKLSIGADGNWTGYITVQATDVVKLIDKNNSSTSYNVTTGAAGEYFVKLIISTGTVVAEKCEYYIAGTVDGAEWGIGATSPKMTWNASAGVYTIDVTVTAGTAFKVLYGTVGNNKEWISNADSSSLFTWDGDGNLVISAAGTYTITYNPTTGKIDIAQK